MSHDPVCRQGYMPTLPCTCALIARARADLDNQQPEPDQYGEDQLPISDDDGLAWLATLHSRGLDVCRNLEHLKEYGARYCPGCKRLAKRRGNALYYKRHK